MVMKDKSKIGLVIIVGLLIFLSLSGLYVENEALGIIATMCKMFLIFAIGLFVYFLPTYIANSRKHNNFVPICIANLFLGWTFIGWVAALVWSTTDNVTRRDSQTINASTNSSTNIVTSLILLTPPLLLSGCIAPLSEVRKGSDNHLEFISTRKADILAGCIQDRWNGTDHPTTGDVVAITNKTENGWMVYQGINGTTMGVADIVPTPKSAKIIYNSNFSKLTREVHLPGIKACL